MEPIPTTELICIVLFFIAVVITIAVLFTAAICTIIDIWFNKIHFVQKDNNIAIKSIMEYEILKNSSVDNPYLLEDEDLMKCK